MLLGLETEFRRRANLPQLDIGLLVRPNRHVICRHIGNSREHIAQLLIKPFLGSLALLDRAFECGDLIHQPLGGSFVLARLGLADLLRRRVAAGLRLLQFLNRGAALLVQAQNLSEGFACAVGAAIGQALNEGVPVLANPFDVEQGGSYRLEIEAFL